METLQVALGRRSYPIYIGGGLLEQLARGGQKQLLSLIPEQLGPVLLLQGVDVLGDGGLGNVKQLGGAGKIFGLADSEKGLNPEIQHSGHLGIIIT